MTNACLRSASWSDVIKDEQRRWPATVDGWDFTSTLHDLYNAEWKMRGFERSP